MGTVVHIPLSELPDSQSLRDRIPIAEEIVFETSGESYRFTRVNKSLGRTAAESLRILALHPDANVMVDEEWSADMLGIMRQNRAHDRDPWID
jgi:hypothetical protein